MLLSHSQTHRSLNERKRDRQCRVESTETVIFICTARQGSSKYHVQFGKLLMLTNGGRPWPLARAHIQNIVKQQKNVHSEFNGCFLL
jgi:hypothetical protein